jgi:FkbM family methyltransferase
VYDETSLVIGLINQNNIKSVLDIGANIGDYSKSLKTFDPNLDIFMLEANESCDDDLKRSGIPYSIKCLSDTEKEVKLFKDKNNPKSTGTSYKLELTDYFSDDNYVIIKSETLDSFLLNHFGFQKFFDFVKMDTQGSEKDIITGGQNTIKNAKFVQLEVSLIPWNKGGPLKEEMMEYMNSIGFVQHLYLSTNYANGKPCSENIVFKNEANI